MSDVKSKASKKWDNATARARGEEMTAPEAGDEMIAKPTGLESMIAPANPTEIAEMLNSGKWEAAPQILKLEEGQMLQGFLEGNGPPAEFTDEDTGEVTVCLTWIISRGSLRVSILSTVQLDKKLPPFIGGEIRIVRGKEHNIGKRRYTDYLVFGPKREDGTARDWSTRPDQKALPAPAAAPAAAAQAESLA